ncbi:MAG: DUF481 domain-containing protein [Pirellulales bacterium]|nr:DUF481 domain-containing protein [Pirellulales bacterium]
MKVLKHSAFFAIVVFTMALLSVLSVVENATAQGWAQPPNPAGNFLPPPGGPQPIQPGPELTVPAPDGLDLPDEIFPGVAAGAPVISPVTWDRSLEFGVSGSEGNSEVFNLRTAARFARTSDLQKSTLDITYRKSEADGAETANLMFAEGRNEWIFDEQSPWSVFIHGTTEYDEFRDYNVRVAADTGLGYYFIRNDCSSFLGRFGGGFSHEIGGMDDSYVPEGVFGAEASHQLTPRSKLNFKADYYPDLSDFGDYRLNTSADWEILMDEVLDVSLKLGLIDRYDSTPGGKKANDLDYSAVLLWKY